MPRAGSIGHQREQGMMIRAGHDAWLTEMAAPGKRLWHGDLQRRLDEFVSEPG